MDTTEESKVGGTGRSGLTHLHGWASQVAPVVKNPSAKAGHTREATRSLGREDPLEKELATHSNILAWRIP